MLKCLFFKNKLYDYLEGNLRDEDKIKVSEHLQECPGCSARVRRIKDILAFVSSKKAPQPSEAFWHDFRVDLDRKLNERLISPPALPKLSRALRPALAYAFSLIFVFTLSIYLFYRNSPNARFARNVQISADEIVMLEELGEEQVLDGDEEAYMSEIDLLFSLDQDLS